MLKSYKLSQVTKFATNPLFLLILVFVINLFLRLYTFEERAPFSWDQVDNAWAAKNIIVEHHFPLVGMQAKQNSGIFIGPAYYYLVAFFYFFTNLDPVASLIVATATSVFTFFGLYYVINKIFGKKCALISLLLYSTSSVIVIQDRYQWPVNLLPIISTIIFYNLLNVIAGKPKHILYLAVFVGLAFHIHFTAIFFIFIILLSLPFFKWNKKIIFYSVFGLLIFLAWLSPLFLNEILSKKQNIHGLQSYIGAYYHGFHIIRVFQLAKDAFIEFESFIPVKTFYFMKYLFIPIFVLLAYLNEKIRKFFAVSYLTTLFFLIPWLVFSTYKGEISNYYFSITKPIAAMIVGYIICRILTVDKLFLKLLVLIYIFIYMFININTYTSKKMHGILYYRQKVNSMITKGENIDFVEGWPESYFYYLYTRNKK